ncbi:ABC transporter related [Beutenbergia cavernae DSM 12333]|uniref:ABC transporter related n=1 Tax=Beutenbergia cavernae (strain ATCC BAA-8 / DSM 12333 / CCUG 43141 / JCM 11478 / NBRC 16432 / NCIMB 13614 / HKI 0122) TaxID=471853 RepID=C5BV59_BEUC1|nr:ABC transporter ATP-binding protein [Beutenbergia cavernae]ACQ80446.1 ABC transporter related [Beutenbergia cavernae DSM 12333]
MTTDLPIDDEVTDDDVARPGADPTAPLVSVRGLEVTFRTEQGPLVAASDVTFDIAAGQTLAIVGESGSGKTTVASAVLGLLPSNGSVTAGQVLVDGRDVARLRPAQLQQMRGRVLGLVPQDPMSNLNPVARVGRQLVETLEDTGVARGAAARTRAAELLAEAGLPDAEDRMGAYPHEFSGGMRQRALIAIGLAGSPRLLVADEPTSALDVTVQRVILDRLEDLTSSLGAAVLLITHDLGLAAERASHVVVMHRGRVVELGPARQILVDPQHEYTKRLLGAAPSLASRRIQIAKDVGADDVVEGADLLAAAARDESADAVATDDAAGAAIPVVRARNLRKVFPGARKGLVGRHPDVVAVDDVSFTIQRGRTLGIVGESGSGKSTVARMLLDLLPPTSGTIEIDGEQVGVRSRAEEVAFRLRVQPIFQDPYSSLDPLYTIYRTIEEPLRAHRLGDADARRARVLELLDAVALPADILNRYPAELSGGQRQRVAIARALAPAPEILVCDEAVSALDVIVQSQILHLLADLQSRLGLSYLFISHDLAVIRQIADEVCVMEHGRVVEAGPTDRVFDDPQDAYTRRLLAAIPGASLDLRLAPPPLS